MDQKKSIAISACLLGHKVRYDGAHQAHKIIIKRLVDSFKIIPVCPEVEIGLGVPREKVELHLQGTKIHLLTCSHPITDLTEQMISYAEVFLENNKISGMILKDKSPSCGVANCKQYDETGHMLPNGTGIFAATVIQLQPDLPLLQSNLINKPSDLECFIEKLNEYEY